MLRVESLPPEAFERLEPPAPSPEFDQMADRYLRGVPWAVAAPYRHRDKNTYVYSRDYLLGNENRSVSLSPFALVMADSVASGKETKPITMLADAAQIDFSSGLSDSEFKVGRVTSGQLLGEVRIEGPDDLLIVGRNFFVDESSKRIWSDDIVQFRYGPHRGKGRGVEIRLGTTESGDGLLAAESIRTVRLREGVLLELLAEGKVRTPELKPTDLISVTSDGHLEFDLETNIATLERNIEVQRPPGPKKEDTLRSDVLTIQFTRDDEDSGQLKPTQLTAQGNVELQSMPNELLVTQVSDLSYLIDERVIEIANTLSFPDGGGPPLKIVQAGNEIVCRRVVVVHDEDNEIVSTTCHGFGYLKNVDQDLEETTIAARWTERLQFAPQPGSNLSMLRLLGDVIVQQPQEATTLSANDVKLWLRENESKRASSEEQSGLTNGRWQPVKMVAEQDVQIVSSRMSGPTNRLEVLFEQSKRQQTGGLRIDKRRFQPSSFPGRQKDAMSQLFDKSYRVRADSIEARVRLNAAEGESELPEVRLNGRVIVAGMDDEETRLDGSSLHILEDVDGNQTMKLIGTRRKPAVVRSKDRLIAGASIYLDRSANEAQVVGSGSLGFVVGKDLEGDELPEAEPLRIVWADGMNFDGQTAILRGRVTATLGDDETQRQELTCPEMRVHFTEAISFTEGLNGGDEEELGKLLRNIECLGGVTVNSFEFAQGRTVEERHGRFRSLNINQKTGDTKAEGPGWITSWTQDRPRLSRSVSAKANASAKARDSKWEYTRIEFLGSVMGNFRQKVTTFDRNVDIVYGPVERLAQVVDPDNTSDGEMPDDSVRIRCDRLQLTVRANRDRSTQTTTREGAGSDKRVVSTLELLGTGNATLEGRKVHAQADVIKYDQDKELFTLMSRGNRLAKIWQRDRIGSRWRDSAGQRFWYSTKTQQLSASGVRGGSMGP